MKQTLNLKKASFLLLAFAFIILPFVPLLLASVSYGWRWPNILPETFSLRAWEHILTSSSGTWQAVSISLLIAGIVTAVNIMLALPAANALVRNKFTGKWLAQAIIFAPIVIPPFVSVMGIHLTFLRLGLTETIFGVILAHLSPTLPYMIRAIMISYQTLSVEWENQAKMLGAGPIARFFHVVLPHLMPGIAAGTSLSMLISLSQYVITFLIGSGQVVTLPILLFPFISGGDPSIASAYSLLFAAMAILTLAVMDVALKKYYRNKNTAMKKTRHRGVEM